MVVDAGGLARVAHPPGPLHALIYDAEAVGRHHGHHQHRLIAPLEVAERLLPLALQTVAMDGGGRHLGLAHAGGWEDGSLLYMTGGAAEDTEGVVDAAAIAGLAAGDAAVECLQNCATGVQHTAEVPPPEPTGSMYRGAVE